LLLQGRARRPEKRRDSARIRPGFHGAMLRLQRRAHAVRRMLRSIGGRAMKNTAPLVLLVALGSGCAELKAPPYQVGGNSYIALQTLHARSGAMLKVGEVRGVNMNETGLQCRAAGKIQPAQGGTFGAFIEQALGAE